MRLDMVGRTVHTERGGLVISLWLLSLFLLAFMAIFRCLPFLLCPSIICSWCSFIIILSFLLLDAAKSWKWRCKVERFQKCHWNKLRLDLLESEDPATEKICYDWLHDENTILTRAAENKIKQLRQYIRIGNSTFNRILIICSTGVIKITYSIKD